MPNALQNWPLSLGKIMSVTIYLNSSVVLGADSAGFQSQGETTCLHSWLSRYDGFLRFTSRPF